MLKNGIIMLVVLLLAGAAVYQHTAAKEKTAALPVETAPKKGFLAPSFTLTGLDGAEYSAGGRRDKPLVVNFWASWCGPCFVEAPDLKKMSDKYKDKVDFYAVNTTKNDFMSDVKDFVKQFNYTFPVLLDKEGTIVDRYRVQIVPTTYLIDRNGVVVDVINVLDINELDKKIRSLSSS